jgi:hypothetical protein
MIKAKGTNKSPVDNNWLSSGQLRLASSRAGGVAGQFVSHNRPACSSSRMTRFFIAFLFPLPFLILQFFKLLSVFCFPAFMFYQPYQVLSFHLVEGRPLLYSV